MNGTKFWLSPGLSGATGNHYCGLHEFEDMSFVLHLLRPTDLFADVGANIGSYTILASAAIGAHSIAFEPIPSSFHWLHQNIVANGVQNKVNAHAIAIADKPGILHFTTQLGPENQISRENDVDSMEVQCNTLDNLLGDAVPNLIKIDVEGFENAVLLGASKILRNPSLQVLIIEIRNKTISSNQNISCHDWLLEFGFAAYTYEPFNRTLISLSQPHHHNTIYIRDIEFVKNRIQAAPPFLLWDITI